MPSQRHATGRGGDGGENGEGLSAVYCGIDIHQSTHTSAVIPRALMEKRGKAWAKTPTLALTNSRADFERLAASLGPPESTAIAIDHTGGHYSAPITHFLMSRGYKVWFLETLAVSDARKRFLDLENKTDVGDAAAMARLLYLRDKLGEPLRISAISPDLGTHAQVLRALVLQRWSYNKAFTQASNRLRQLFIATFPEGEAFAFEALCDLALFHPDPRTLGQAQPWAFPTIKPSVLSRLQALAQDTVGIPAQPYQDIIRRLADQRRISRDLREDLTARLDHLVRVHPYGPILLSFPYLGPAAAATIIGAVGDIARFPNRKRFRKALGCYATLRESGSPNKDQRKPSGKRESKMGRQGSRDARRVLFQTVMGLVSGRAPDNPIRRYHHKKVKEGRKPIRSIAASMGKLAELIYHCLKEGQPYEPPR